MAGLYRKPNDRRPNVVRPQGTPRVLRPPSSSSAVIPRSFAGGSRPALSIGHGSGMASGGGGFDQAAVAKALASTAAPAAPAPEVYAPQPVTPFAPQPVTPFAPQPAPAVPTGGDAPVYGAPQGEAGFGKPLLMPEDTGLQPEPQAPDADAQARELAMRLARLARLEGGY